MVSLGRETNTDVENHCNVGAELLFDPDRLLGTEPHLGSVVDVFEQGVFLGDLGP